jgi:hypothetical protein
MSKPEPTGVNSVWTGFIVGVAATVTWYFVVAYATGLTNNGFMTALAIGSGVMFLVGVLLMLPKRTWRLGVGIAIGAPIALVVETVILVLLIMSVTS